MSFREWLNKAKKDLALAKHSLELGYYDLLHSTPSSVQRKR